MSVSKNSTYNLAGSLVPLILALATIPLYLQQVGVERYGALAIVWLILGYFGLFDLGLGRATAQRIAALARSGSEHRANVFVTAAIVNIGMGVVGSVLLYIGAAYFFAEHFAAADWLRSEAVDAVPFLALSVPIAMLTGVASGALQGREKFLDVNVAMVISTTLFQIVPLVTAYIYGPTLKWLVLSALIARMIGFCVFMLRVHKHLLVGLTPRFDRNEWLALVKYGGWVTVTSIISPLLVVIDRFMIGSSISATAVSIYTIPFEIVQRVSLLPRAISMALFPRMAIATDERGHEIVDRATRVIAFLVTPLVFVGMFGMGPFLTIWVGEHISSQAQPIGIVLLLGYWVNAFAKIPYSRLHAIGQPQIVAGILLVQVPFYIAALYIGLMTFGLMGAAVVFSARTAIDYLLLHRCSSRRWQVPSCIVLWAVFLLPAALINLYWPTFSVLWLGAALVMSTSLLWTLMQHVPQELRGIVERLAPALFFRMLRFA